MAKANKVQVTLIKSTISCTAAQKGTVQALGLKKINSFKIHDESASILGMIEKVSYLLKVEKI